ncbi:phosphatidate cytidylyltransferase [Thermoflavifilum thermophilum]|uniref:Phosphatidate cytidylyltransferase n=1 Tax=Thermoflavifilum thermophilum TaxID=1393122 RepID=A0A1I7N846_9BACT|nr:phosphatidate cytidylyltransferase [Thermoflavifilum thermophilum]SFV30840.1 phosphatidate cytidylyltransferase [Thermoflavifilum thermophilum]
MGTLSRTFFTRSITAVVFVAIMLLGLLLNRYSFLVLFTIIAVGCLWEYQQLTNLIMMVVSDNSKGKKRNLINQIAMWLAVMGILLMAMGLASSVQSPRVDAIGLDILMISFVLIPVSELFIGQFRFAFVMLSLAGCLYVGLAPALMIYFRWQQMHASLQWIPVIIIGCLWVNDTMAYITGSLLGKHKLWPAVSPGKTWEGTLGGIVCTMLLALVASEIWPLFSKWHWIMIALLVGIFGTMGDLLESALKRMAGVKDSGQLMPGHGGLLDRFDSMLIAVPVVWLYVHIWML